MVSRASSRIYLVGSLLWTVACQQREAPTHTPPAARAETSTRAAVAAPDPIARADAAAKKLGGALKARLVEAMGQGGPPSAVRVCADEAPSIAARVRGETGVSVGRASLRPRSPGNVPPEWVGAWLSAQGERKAEGLTGTSTVVDTATGRVARVLKPIAIEALCLACHGDPASIAPEVSAVLKTTYPADRALGYALGDLRGALWAEAPLP